MLVPTAPKVWRVLTFNGQPVQFADIFKIEGKEQYFSLKPLEVLNDFCCFLVFHLIIDSWFQNLVSRMLYLNKETIPGLTKFQEFIQYEDVLYNLLGVLGTILKSKVEEDENFL